MVMLLGEYSWVKADVVLFALCDPYLSALQAFAKTNYTNLCYLYLPSFMLCSLHPIGVVGITAKKNPEFVRMESSSKSHVFKSDLCLVKSNPN